MADIITGMTDEQRGVALKEAEERNLKDQRQKDIADLVNQQNSALKDQPGVVDRIMKPHYVRGSEYHLYHSKNSGIGFYEQGDGLLITLMERQKNLTLFMVHSGLVKQDLVDHVNSVCEAWIDYKRGIDGKTANMISKQQITVTSIEEKPQEKGTFKR